MARPAAGRPDGGGRTPVAVRAERGAGSAAVAPAVQPVTRQARREAGGRVAAERVAGVRRARARGVEEMHQACRRCCSKARTAKSKGGSTTVRPMSAWWPARRRSHTLPLLDEDFVAVAADGMFAGRKSVSAKQLSTAPFIFSKAGCGPVIADYFARGGCRCGPRSTWSRCAPFCRWPRPAWACRSCRASRSRTRRSAAACWNCRPGCIDRCGCRGIRPATRSRTSSCGSSTRNARRRRRRSTRARKAR